MCKWRNNVSPLALHWLLSFLSLLFSTAWAIASFSCSSETCEKFISGMKQLPWNWYLRYSCFLMRSIIIKAVALKRRDLQEGTVVHTVAATHADSWCHVLHWVRLAVFLDGHSDDDDQHINMQEHWMEVSHTLGLGCRLMIMWTGPGMHWLRTV